jgi:hypothetical protein
MTKFDIKSVFLGAAVGAVVTTGLGIAHAAGQVFTDVSSSAWYANAVNWAAEKGLMSGMGNGNFAPNEPVTRAQLAAVLKNLSEAGMLGGGNTNGSTTNDNNSGNDNSSTSTDANKLTLANYEKIQKGMTLAEVEAILGKGVKQSDYSSTYVSSAVYEWEDSSTGKDILITFSTEERQDKQLGVESKTEMGLE